MSQRTRPARIRQCQMNGCYDNALTGQIFCHRHVVSPEGVRFHKEVQAIATWLVAHEEAPTVEDVERQKLRERFQRRVERGDFNTLLDAATGTILAQAAAQRHHQLELGALRFATRDWERPEVVQWIGEQARRRADEELGDGEWGMGDGAEPGEEAVEIDEGARPVWVYEVAGRETG